jgi:mannose-6-phosphate isomerase-like protein (cupin superfamily)
VKNVTGQKQNLLKLFMEVDSYFSPRIVGEVNEVYIKIVKVKGQEVPWHTHDGEDEMFYVIKGRLTMEFKGRDTVQLESGEFFIVSKGLEHRVFSEKECWLMLIENKSTRHTGNVKSSITKTIDEQFY